MYLLRSFKRQKYDVEGVHLSEERGAINVRLGVRSPSRPIVRNLQSGVEARTAIMRRRGELATASVSLGIVVSSANGFNMFTQVSTCM